MIETLDEYWAKLVALGWTKRMNPEVLKANRANLERVFREEPYLAYRVFTTGGHDVKCLESDGDYVKLLAAYSEASGGVFNPTEASDQFDYERRTASVAFTFAGRRYELAVPFESKYVPDEFDELVACALEAAGVEERFFVLPDIEDIAYVTFMKPETHRQAIDSGLLPEDWDEVEDAQYEWQSGEDPE